MTFLRTISVAMLSGLALPALLTAQGGRGGEPPKNLQVLPKDMPRQQVNAVMNSMNAALGVRCEHCHSADPNAPAPTPGAGGGRGGPPLDFAADTKDEKKIAREMLKMVMDINGKYLTLIGRTIGDRDKVSCETCHHGLVRPQTLRAALAGAVEAKGADSATALYRDLRAKYYGSAAYDFSELSLARTAGELAQTNQRPAALAMLKLNLEFFDKSAPTYQSLAQISLAGGDTVSAVDALKKAIALQPNNPQLQNLLQRIAPKP
jgi:tetratricopeptide (TPR) repeat protein